MLQLIQRNWLTGVLCLSSSFAALAQPGTLDLSFDPGTGANDQIRCVAVQVDGKILVGGEFTEFQGVSRNGVARLDANGTLDTGFDPGSGANELVRSIVVQPDGKVLIAGDFSSYDGVARSCIVRVNSDGTLDQSFDPGFGAGDNVWSMALRPDGKIFIVGGFLSYDGEPCERVALLNSDGSLDSGFNTASAAGQAVYTCALQPDGELIIGGIFAEYAGVQRDRIARINTDGSLDMSFDPGSGADLPITSIVVQNDGKILIGGGFTSYNGTACKCIARLNADASLDGTFAVGVGPNGSINGAALSANGTILVVGSFSQFSGVYRGRLARLHANGALDAGFVSVSGANQTVYSVCTQSDGQVLIGGHFSSCGGVSRNGVARFNGGTGVSIAAVERDRAVPSVHPNPIDGAARIVMPDPGTYQVSLLRSDGVLLYTKEYTILSGTLQLDDTENLARGVYFCVISDSHQKWMLRLIAS